MKTFNVSFFCSGMGVFQVNYSAVTRCLLAGIAMLMLLATVGTGCTPRGASNPATGTEAFDSQKQAHCNHPIFADTVVTFTCSEAMGCNPTPPTNTKKNGIRFRVSSHCANANYNFHNVPVRYGVYRVQSIVGGNYNFHRVAHFTCMSSNMVIASNQFLNNNVYMVSMEENPNIIPALNVTLPIINGSGFTNWIFRVKNFRGKPCNVQ